jgi:hypothetical protein
LEVRAAIQAVDDLISNYGNTPPFRNVEWRDLGAGRPRADVMNQLSGLILQPQ